MALPEGEVPGETVWTMSIDLEQAMDDLYGADLDEFVSERNRIAAELRKEGRRAEAAQVKELRKPGLSAWTVNQLARRHRKDVDLLLDAGHRLAAAQAEVISGGDPAHFDEARGREQEALKRLRQAAAKVLGDRSASGTIERVSSTLRAAAVSEEGREQLARGRLSGDVEASGFEAFAGIAPAAKTVPKSTKGTKEAKAKPKRRDERSYREAVAQARATLKAARERESESTRQLRQAEKALAQARREVENAEGAVEDAEADRRAAAEETAAAEQALDEARKAR
jgi:hypothetical protein